MRTSGALCLVVLVACGDGDDSPRADARVADGSLTDTSGTDAGIDASEVLGSQQIADARAAADGTGLSLPITDVVVTYIKPAGSNTVYDPPGFTVQAEQLGPALMIAVDPAGLTPVPTVGDTVSFTVTALTTVLLQRRATAITGFTRSTQGTNVTPLAQDVSNTLNLISGINNYESELVDATLTVTSDFVDSPSAGFELASVNTAALAGNVNLRLRMPSTLNDTLGLVNGCVVTVAAVPVSRNQAEAFFTVFAVDDVTITSCP